MKQSDFEIACAVVQASGDSPGKERLLTFLAHSERLHNGTMTELHSVGPDAANVTLFHDKLVQLRATLQPVHELLMEMEVGVRDMRFERQVSWDMADAVGKVLHMQSHELNGLL